MYVKNVMLCTRRPAHHETGRCTTTNNSNNNNNNNNNNSDAFPPVPTRSNSQLCSNPALQKKNNKLLSEQIACPIYMYIQHG